MYSKFTCGEDSRNNNPIGKLGELSFKMDVQISLFDLKNVYIYTYTCIFGMCFYVKIVGKSKLLKLASLSNEIFSSDLNIPRDHF